MRILRAKKGRNISIFLALLIIIVGGFFIVTKVFAATKCWDGGGTTNNWSELANWAGDSLPGTTDVATFHGASCTAGTPDKSVTIDQNVTLSGAAGGINIGSDYAGTITQGAGYTITVGTGNWTQAGGTFVGSNSGGGLGINITSTGASAFSLTGGSFTAPSGIATISGSFTISGSATFASNSGTVSFSSGSGAVGGTFACNNAVFNLVTINKAYTGGSANTVTIGSDCSFPLGNNPTVVAGTGAHASSKLNINGTLSGTGTLTVDTGNVVHVITFSNTSGISGFSGLASSANSSIAIPTLNLSSYSSVAFSGYFTFLGTTFTAPSAGDMSVGGDFTNSGTFTAPSGTLTVGGGFDNTGGAFTHNSGTVAFSSGSGTSGGTFACNNAVFNAVSINKAYTGGSLSSVVIGSDCSFPLGNNPTVTAGTGAHSGNTFTLNGTLSGSGTLTVNTGNNHTTTFSSTAVISGFNGLVMADDFVTAIPTLNLSSYSPVTFDGSFTNSGTFTASSGAMTVSGVFTNSGVFIPPSAGNMSVTGSFTNSGTFTAPSGTLTVGGGFDNAGGTFTHNSGTVAFSSATAATRTFACNNAVFNAVSINLTYASSGTNTTTVNSDCSFPLGNNPTVTASNGTAYSLTVNGTFSGTGTLTIASNNVIFSSTAAISGFNGFAVFDGFTTSATTLDLGAYSSVDFNGAFTLTAGTFTAPSSGTMTVAGNFVRTAGTFNTNGGTITFDGTTQTLTCTAATTFNKIIITSSTAFTFPTNCTATLDTGSMSGTFTMSGGTLTPATGAAPDFNSSFTLTGGSFTAPSGTMTIAGGLTISGSPTFTHNSGTVTFDGTGTVTYACNNVTFNRVNINRTGGAAITTVGSDCSLPLGANPTVASGVSGGSTSSFVLNGTLSGTGTLTINSGTSGSGTSFTSTGTLSGFTGLTTASEFTTAKATQNLSSYSQLTFGGDFLLSAGTFTAPNPGSMSVAGNFTLSAGTTFIAPSGTLAIAGNFNNTAAGTFTHNSGTVNLNGTATQVITGVMTFYNFDLTSTVARQITFPNTSVQTINNRFTAIGVSLGNNITLKNTSSTTQFKLAVKGPQNVMWATVQNSSACSGHSLIDISGTNSGNNSCWIFGTGTSKTYILPGVQINSGVTID